MVFLITQFIPERKETPSSSSSNNARFRPEETQLLERSCHRFSLADIKLATQNFNDSLVIGRGGFGKVYKGLIHNGPAAIKRLDSMSNQGASEFWAEIEMLSRLRHCHLVTLIGYCNDRKEMILVYEYVPNGTLHDHLHTYGGTALSWMQRLQICLGAARGLDYLHDGTGVIHRDVKTSNILLDESWAAKISDFGLSKIGPSNDLSTHVSTIVKGTVGYLDPDYLFTGRLTRKSDVYAFGVTLLEVLCGRRAVDTSLDKNQRVLVRWAQDCNKQGNLEQIIDSSLRGQILPKCLKEFAQIANRCLHIHPKERPTMAEVVASLGSALALQEGMDNSIFSVPSKRSSTAFTVSPRKSLTTFTVKTKKFFFSLVGGNSGSKKAKASSAGMSATEPVITSLSTSSSETIPTTASVLPPPVLSSAITIVTASTSSSILSMSQELPVTLPPSFLPLSTAELPLTTSTMTSSTMNAPNSQLGSEVYTEGPIGSSMKLALQNLASEMAALSLSKPSTSQFSIPSTSGHNSVPFVIPLEPWRSSKMLIEGVWVHQNYEKL